MKWTFIIAGAVGLSLVASHVVRADIAAVNKYLGEATELVGKGPQFFDDAGGKLELAEASMDDVPAADQPALKAKIDALKTQITGAANAQEAKILDGKLKRAMESAEGSIGNLVTWKGAAREVREYLDDPKTTTLLGADAVAAYRKQFATFEKLNGGKALKENLSNATTQVEELEKAWSERKATLADADASPNSKESALTDTERDLTGIERAFADLPADNADVKALRGRVDKVKSDQLAATASAGAAGALEDINRFVESYQTEVAEADAEAAAPTPTWESYRTTGKSVSDKTSDFVRRFGGYLKDLPENEGYVAAKDNAAVKAKVAELSAKVEAGRARLKKNFESIVAGLEKDKIDVNTQGTATRLGIEIRNAFGEESDDAKALVARVTKVETDFTAAGEKAEGEKVAYYKKMTEQADKAWPDMMAKFDVTDGFDPNNYKDFKGKYVKITTDNLMGYHFKPGDFPFATTINGKPVAGKYDPAIAAALAEVEGKIGRGIGDSDDDGKWIVIAKVDGTTGTLYQKQEVTGDLTDRGGSSVGSWSGTQVTPVESPIITIVALKAGPVAAAAGQGTVKEDGSVGKSAPPPAGSALASGTASGGHRISLFGIVMGLLSIAVGAACLMKAKFAPLATNAGAVQFTEKVGGQNLRYLGLAGIALGVLGVIMNLIALPGAFIAALIGLVASLAMIVAGGVASREFFEERKILPAQAGPILTQFAIPAGLACAALGLLTVIVSL